MVPVKFLTGQKLRMVSCSIHMESMLTLQKFEHLAVQTLNSKIEVKILTNMVKYLNGKVLTP